MQAINVIKQDHLGSLQVQGGEIMSPRGLLHMQGRTAGHRREGADGIELKAAVTEVGIAVVVAHPAVARQTKAVGGDALGVAGFTNPGHHPPAQRRIQPLLLGVLLVKALVGVGAVVRTGLKQGIGPHMGLQLLQRQRHRLGHRRRIGLRFMAAGQPL